MLIAIFAGLLVSIDALFIGVSFGTQKKCKFWHVALINIVLIALCFVGFYLGILIGERIDFELDLVIGLLFITLGLLVIATHRKESSTRNIWLTGVFMSVEAMFITIGLTLTLDTTTLLIPITVGLAHFAYSLATFFLAKYLRKLPPMAGAIIAGTALIIYGVMAILI